MLVGYLPKARRATIWLMSLSIFSACNGSSALCGLEGAPGRGTASVNTSGTMPMDSMIELVLSVVTGFDRSRCEGPPEAVVERILHDLGDQDESGVLSDAEMRFLSEVVATRFQPTTASEVCEEESRIISSLSELEISSRIAAFDSIELRLKSECAGDSFVFSVEILEGSAGALAGTGGIWG